MNWYERIRAMRENPKTFNAGYRIIAEPFITIEYYDLFDLNSLILDSVEDNDNGEFAMINPDLIDFHIASSSHAVCEIGIARAIVINNLLQNDQLCEMCYNLNNEQQHVFIS